MDMCTTYTWDVAIPIHYTIYNLHNIYSIHNIYYTIYTYTELLFEGNILSYLSNRDVRHLFNGCIYSRAVLISGYKLSVEIKQTLAGVGKQKQNNKYFKLHSMILLIS